MPSRSIVQRATHEFTGTTWYWIHLRISNTHPTKLTKGSILIYIVLGVTKFSHQRQLSASSSWDNVFFSFFKAARNKPLENGLKVLLDDAKMNVDSFQMTYIGNLFLTHMLLEQPGKKETDCQTLFCLFDQLTAAHNITDDRQEKLKGSCC